MTRGRLAAGALAAAAIAVIAVLVTSRSGAGTAAPKPPSAQLPPPVRPAFTPGAPRRLGPTRFLSHWAPVRRAVTALSRPDSRAPAVARVATSTPEGTTNIVRVLGHRTDHRGRLWVRIALAVLPNGRTGWVPRSALRGYGTVDTSLVVDLRRFTATLFKRGRPVLRAPVGVGQSRWPTPRGTFYVRNRLERFAGATYGPVAFGISARSAHLTDWPDGGFIGIHGTDQPQLIPGRISHGCIRMRNRDILALDRLMPIGTPVTIR